MTSAAKNGAPNDVVHWRVDGGNKTTTNYTTTTDSKDNHHSTREQNNSNGLKNCGGN